MKYLARSKVFLYILVAFMAGVFIGPYVGSFLVELPIIIILLNCYIVTLLLVLVRNKVFRITLILLLVVLIGAWRYQAFLPKINENHIVFYNDNKETYAIEGSVSAEPAEKGNSLSLQISNVRINPNDQTPKPNEILNTKKLNGDILLTTPKYFEVEYGDRVRFNAKLATPTQYDTFDYRDYLARYGVYAIAKSVDQFEVVDSSCGGVVYCAQRGLYEIKNYFSSVINKIYPEPHASFMLGVLIGAKSSLPDWLLNIFQIIGITHIIAISGYNITILAKVADGTLGKIGRKYIFWGVLTMILAFVVMTGASASVVRAGIMGALLVYAGFIGRKSNAVNVLIFAGAVMILLNPLILRNDIGFQLSFLATMGLVFISPIFEKWFARMPEFFRVLLSATLAAQVLTLPIIVSGFGRLSLISPISNIIILPFIPLSMFLGFLSGGLGMVWLPLGRIVGFFGYIILEIVIKISGLLAGIPYASLELKVNNWFVWGTYYLLVGILVLFWHKRKRK